MDFYTKVTVLSAVAVMTVQQILKLKFIPAGFANRYPVPTLILLSVIAAVVAVWQNLVIPHAWSDWIVLVVLIAVVAAVTYRSTLRNWTQLREMEGEG